mmetsp:Transcript_5760/g.7545  ORF Transcript_5760/g.7545 Transcript_5760/m.7545 type:complete len:117 (+) Transcript_5760:375-725(+)
MRAVTFFQIVLCLVVKCVGISIIWCAMAGWIAMDNNIVESSNSRPTTNRNHHPSVVIFLDAIAILYYAIVEEPITTVAHILAIVVLGIPLHAMTNRFSGLKSTTNPESNSIQRGLL